MDGPLRICAANVGKFQILCGRFKDGLRGAAEEAQGVSAFAPMTDFCEYQTNLLQPLGGSGIWVKLLWSSADPLKNASQSGQRLRFWGNFREVVDEKSEGR